MHRRPLRFVPGARRQRWHADIDAGYHLRRAQRHHARKVDPGTLPARGIPIENDHVRHAFASEAESRGKAALTGADDDDIEDGPVGMLAPDHPGSGWITYEIQFAPDPRLEIYQAHLI